MEARLLHVKHVTRYLIYATLHEGKKGDSIEEQLTFTCETYNITFTSQEDLKQHSIKEHEGRQ